MEDELTQGRPCGVTVWGVDAPGRPDFTVRGTGLSGIFWVPWGHWPTGALVATRAHGPPSHPALTVGWGPGRDALLGAGRPGLEAARLSAARCTGTLPRLGASPARGKAGVQGPLVPLEEAGQPPAHQCPPTGSP